MPMLRLKTSKGCGMRIKSVAYKIGKEYLTGTIKVQDGRRVINVKFDQDKKGNYGWSQWGASTEVLGLTMSTVEKLSNKYLMGEL